MATDACVLPPQGFNSCHPVTNNFGRGSDQPLGPSLANTGFEFAAPIGSIVHHSPHLTVPLEQLPLSQRSDSLTTLKYFVCDMCDKRFSFASLLQRHMTKHTGERPFPCPHCPHRSKQRANLQRHILTHEIKNKQQEQ